MEGPSHLAARTESERCKKDGPAAGPRTSGAMVYGPYPLASHPSLHRVPSGSRSCPVDGPPGSQRRPARVPQGSRSHPTQVPPPSRSRPKCPIAAPQMRPRALRSRHDRRGYRPPPEEGQERRAGRLVSDLPVPEEASRQASASRRETAVLLDGDRCRDGRGRTTRRNRQCSGAQCGPQSLGSSVPRPRRRRR